MRRFASLTGVIALCLVVLTLNSGFLTVYSLTQGAETRRIIDRLACQDKANLVFQQGLVARSAAQKAYQDADRAYVEADKTFVQSQRRYLLIVTNQGEPLGIRDQAQKDYFTAIDAKLASADRETAALDDLDKARSDNPVNPTLQCAGPQ